MFGLAAAGSVCGLISSMKRSKFVRAIVIAICFAFFAGSVIGIVWMISVVVDEVETCFSNKIV